MSKEMEIVKYTKNAYAGKYTVKEAKDALAAISEKYDGPIFTPGSSHKKERPWTRKYLDELKVYADNGAGSEEFLINLAEVGYEVRRKERIKLVATIAIAVAAVAAITALIISLLNN